MRVGLCVVCNDLSRALREDNKKGHDQHMPANDLLMPASPSKIAADQSRVSTCLEDLTRREPLT